MRIPSPSPYAPTIGFSAAVRSGDWIHVAGMTALNAEGEIADDAGDQAREVLRKIAAALNDAGASLEDVVRTRIYLTDAQDWEAVGRVHGEVFAAVRPVATMVVAGLLDGRPMEASEEDVAALQIFAARAAAELERRRQAAALEASRTRAIEAADAERRRIGRDLHDGAQQRLVAIANLLTVARKKTGDPVLELAADELTAANTELRELARGLYPVALAERGLKDAVESLAGTCATPVTVDIRDAAVPERAALAAYFVISEALTNIVKHASATEASVLLEREPATVRVRVADDGAGGARIKPEAGLAGLRDRLEALDATLSITSEAGLGTTVCAEFPCGS
jgi:signal transduction histidine kinase